FFFHETSPGMAYWLPKGLTLYNELLSFSRKVHKQYGYLEIATPILNKKELYETSGHWQHYRGDMFISPMSLIRNESKDVFAGTEVFGVKPMNCPNAMNVFAISTRSYRDLPLRFSETSVLHRFELSGTLNGLFRCREFRQDDAHVFMRMDQLKEEFEKIMEMIQIFYGAFKLDYRLRFGTRPEGAMGETKDWDKAEEALEEVLKTSKKEYTKEEGEGAFYGPKIDILMKDSLGREWQTGTIQLDFQQPKNFHLKYIDQNGKEETPAVIHRAIYGSFERFIGILTEHFAGSFPAWLSPTQVVILPITDKQLTYSQKIVEVLQQKGIRTKVDERNERLQAKIRDATLAKVPYLLVVGGKEEEANTVAVRTHDGRDLGAMKIEEFLDKITKDVENKS
ncbi:MAG TPA: threonine--tRNA ligase, partial [Candidatus Saccharimonadales bacterium]|nr:threonine--tRNA ligase [Candidatus Saccharimonadales bacterium]